MERNNLTPEESLGIISGAITNYKINYRESAYVFLLWGWILALASLSNFVILHILRSNEEYGLMGILSFSNWAVFSVIGFVLLFFWMRKVEKKKKVYSHLESYVKSLWTVAGVSFGIAIIICVRLELNPPPFMLLIAGLATTVNGILIKFKPMIFGGIAFFIFSVSSTFVPEVYTALIVCLSIVVGYLVPGYLLKSAKD